VLELKGVASITKVACADHHIIALDSRGRVFAWGRGYASGMEGPTHTPHQLPLPTTSGGGEGGGGGGAGAGEGGGGGGGEGGGEAPAREAEGNQVRSALSRPASCLSL
jgi:hypothetical protein